MGRDACVPPPGWSGTAGRGVVQGRGGGGLGLILAGIWPGSCPFISPKSRSNLLSVCVCPPAPELGEGGTLSPPRPGEGRGEGAVCFKAFNAIKTSGLGSVGTERSPGWGGGTPKVAGGRGGRSRVWGRGAGLPQGDGDGASPRPPSVARHLLISQGRDPPHHDTGSDTPPHPATAGSSIPGLGASSGSARGFPLPGPAPSHPSLSWDTRI